MSLQHRIDLACHRVGTWWALALWLAAASAVAQAPVPGTEPIPVVELGMHTSGIESVATDRDGRFVLTASTDKTARIWDLATGKLLQVLRPPQGEGNDGKMYGAALSPDGRTAVVGGWTQPGNHSIFIFDGPTGRLLRRIDGLPNTVNGLAYSPDGRLLAAGVGAGSGLRLYDTTTWREVVRETSYTGGLRKPYFSPDGQRLVAGGIDGLLHTYALQGAQWRATLVAPAPGGKQPLSPRYSPDGRFIALGYFDANIVSVLDSRTLAEVGRPPVNPNSKYTALVWSADGRSLHAGTSEKVGAQNLLRTWDTADPNRFTEVTIATNSVVTAQALPDGRVLFGSLDPSWGVVHPDGRVDRHFPLGADLRRQREGFRVSADARRVRFSHQQDMQPFLVFDFSAGGLVADDPSMKAPRIQAPGMVIDKWQGFVGIPPTLNGNPLSVFDGEISRSLDIAADGSRFVLGTDWALLMFDAKGQRIWRQPVTSSTWAVALSADGRHVVSGHGDGTIRWRRTDNGREVLTLFLHGDGQGWVAWTPEGFFDASPGGEALIGHHLNRGVGAAGDFISASQLRDRYFQPGLVARRLEPGGDELIAAAVRSRGDVRQVLNGAASLPPQVELLSSAAAAGASGDVTVQVKVNERGGGVGGLTFYLDGKPMEGRQAAISGDATVSRSFALPPGRYKLEVAATSRGGVEGQRVVQELVVSGTAAPAALHILAVGVEKYRDPKLELKNSANDAARLGAELSARAKPLFPRGVNLSVLRDEQASLAGIEAAFDKLRTQFKAEDTLVVFLAGHGESGAGGGYVFLPWDFERGAAGPKGEGLNEARLQAMLKTSPAKTLMLIDTCEAGSAEDMVAGAYRRLNGLTQHVLIGASRKGELAREGYNGHGVFTAALLETLARKPDDADDKSMSVVELSAFVEKSVSRIARTLPGYQQKVSGYLGSARFPVVAR